MSNTETIEKPKDLTRDDPDAQKPKMYAVLVHNDPFTPRQFVVSVLQRYFQKNAQQANQIMLTAHTQGYGAVGVYTFEIAEMKANVANVYSREQGYPLYFSVEED
jgi:ATP-dependent Clp protease adaptor protein ClpS